MVAKRLIACLDVRDGSVVKGINFTGLRHAGDPAELAERYSASGIDEIVVLDISATIDGREALAGAVRAVVDRAGIPVTAGGGIRSVDDAHRLLDAGADKVSLNSAALRDPSLVTRLADRFGTQAVVVAIDAARHDGADVVFSRAGTTKESREAAAWAAEVEARGAGEILLTSIDRDGTRLGFDCRLTARVSDAVRIPVIASGGAGCAGDFVAVFTDGCADAALAASIFHLSGVSVASLKAHLAAAGIPVRRGW